MVLKLTNEEMHIIRSALCDKLAKSFVNATKEAEELEKLGRPDEENISLYVHDKIKKLIDKVDEVWEIEDIR